MPIFEDHKKSGAIFFEFYAPLVKWIGLNWNLNELMSHDIWLLPELGFKKKNSRTDEYKVIRLCLSAKLKAPILAAADIFSCLMWKNKPVIKSLHVNNLLTENQQIY
jgi:hypothetical protein